MLRLLPINTEQTVDITPRNYDFSGKVISIVVNEEQTRNKQTLTGLVASSNGNYVNVSLTYDFTNKEDFTYDVSFYLDGNIWYRDKIYITSSTDTRLYHKIKNTDYVDRDTENEYIVL